MKDLTLGNYKLETDPSDGDEIRIRHLETGETVTVDRGTLNGDSLNIDQATVGQAYRNPIPADGTAGIQTAVKEVGEAGGGIVELQVGEYPVNNGAQYPGQALLFKWDNVTLVGQGRATVIKVPDGYTPTDDGQKVIDIGGNAADDGNDQVSGFTSNVTVDGCCIANLRIDGNWENQGNILGNDDGHNIQVYGSNNHFYNLWSVNATGDGIEPTAHDAADPPTEGTIVWGCTFRNCWEQLIHNHKATGSLYYGNYCETEVNNAGVFFTNPVHEGPIYFVNNVVKDSGASGIAVHNANSLSPSHLYLLDNYVGGNDLWGIQLKAGDSEDVTIRGNEIAHNGDSGIRANGAVRVFIENNYIHHNDEHGINANDGNPIDLLRIKNNIITENDQGNLNRNGIHIQAGNGSTIDRLFIEDNIIYSSGNEHDRGIIFGGSSPSSHSNVVVEGNYIEGFQKDAYLFSSFMPEYVRDNTPAAFLSSTTKAEEGNWYWDDGTNTVSGTPGKRVYLNGGWVDAFTA